MCFSSYPRGDALVDTWLASISMPNVFFIAFVSKDSHSSERSDHLHNSYWDLLYSLSFAVWVRQIRFQETEALALRGWFFNTNQLYLRLLDPPECGKQMENYQRTLMPLWGQCVDSSQDCVKTKGNVPLCKDKRDAWTHMCLIYQIMSPCLLSSSLQCLTKTYSVVSCIWQKLPWIIKCLIPSRACICSLM